MLMYSFDLINLKQNKSKVATMCLKPHCIWFFIEKTLKTMKEIEEITQFYDFITINIIYSSFNLLLLPLLI